MKRCDKFSDGKIGQYVKKLTVKCLQVKNLKACKIDTKEILVNGVNVQTAAQNSSQTVDSQFDCMAPNPAFPHFGDSAPVKPSSFPISDELWNALLDNLNTEQQRLTDNFIAGRQTLGLPQCERNDSDEKELLVNLMATKTIPLVIKNEAAKSISYQSVISWDLHCINTFYNDFYNPETVSMKAHINMDGNLEVSSISNDTELAFGQVVRGDPIPWGTTILDQLSGEEGSTGIYTLQTANDLSLTPFSEDRDLQASKWGPKTISVFIQAGTLSADGTIEMTNLENGNRQFEPTIDWSSSDQGGETHTGEQWTGTRQIPNGVINSLYVKNQSAIPVLQLAVFAEQDVKIYYKKPLNCQMSVGSLDNAGSSTSTTGVTSTTNTASTASQVVVSAMGSAVAEAGDPRQWTYTLAQPYSLGADAVFGTRLNFSGYTGADAIFNQTASDTMGLTINGTVITFSTSAVPIGPAVNTVSPGSVSLAI